MSKIESLARWQTYSYFRNMFHAIVSRDFGITLDVLDFLDVLGVLGGKSFLCASMANNPTPAAATPPA